MRMPPPRSVMTGLAVAALLALVHALMIGSVNLSWTDLMSVARDPSASPLFVVLMDLRLPRAVSAFAAGGLLALAGVLLQALLRNPLADPYVLGVSAGASMSALLAFVLWGAALPLWAAQVAAAVGSMLTLLLLFTLARQAFFARALSGSNGQDSGVAVLLTGVMLASFFGAVVSVLLALAGDGPLRSMVFWLLGDLAGATDLRLALMACVVLWLCVWMARHHAPAMNLMLRGDVLAYTQGVNVVRTRRVLVFTAALATGSAVSLAGAVGFVGFVAPHLVRLVLGNDQRVLVPAAALVGGTLVVLADTVARTVIAPVQLPVGVVTALVGVPVFLGLMRKQ